MKQLNNVLMEGKTGSYGYQGGIVIQFELVTDTGSYMVDVRDRKIPSEGFIQGREVRVVGSLRHLGSFIDIVGQHIEFKPVRNQEVY